jgi:hypothetical protein
MMKTIVICTGLMASMTFAQTPLDVPNIAPRLGTQAVFVSPSGEVFRAALSEAYPVGQWFSQADTDKDGALSRDEFIADAKRFFDVVDQDAKGIITSLDNSRYEAELAPEITGFSPMVSRNNPRAKPSDSVRPDGGPMAYSQGIQGAAQFGLINEPQPIRAADANLDFRVTLDEWLKTSGQRFSLLDLNKDGKILLDELPKTPLQLALEARGNSNSPPKARRKGWF